MSATLGVQTLLFIVLGLTTRYSIGQGTCPALEQPPYVEFPMRCTNSPGERCYIGCQRGFELIGSCHRTCCLSGRWTGQPARCINRNIQCPPLNPPVEGQFVDQCLNFAGYTCYFQCNSGLPPFGSPSSDCLQSGLWSTPTPTCGGPTPHPVTGFPVTNGPTDQPPNCFDINPPKNGAIRGVCVNATDCSECLFECDPGFALYGVTRISCENRTWSNIAPTCSLVTCSSVTSPMNGRAEGQCVPGISDQSCTITCDPGFSISSNNPVITCTISGTWTYPPAQCNRIKCESRTDSILNGFKSGDCTPGYPFQLCIYRCNPGYAVVGDSTFFCGGDGQWVGNNATCVRILCPTLRAVGNLTLSGACDPGYVGSTCAFSCPSRLNLIGISEAMCMPNGEWSSPRPTCETIRCAKIDPPDNGRFVESNGLCPMRASTQCTVACYEGFSTSDRARNYTLNCDETGIWTSPVVDCQSVRCQPLNAPLHGKATDSCFTAVSGGKCYMTCDQYYRLDGDGVFTCQISGTWDPTTLFTCVRATCITPLPNITNGVKRGTCSPGLAGEQCIYSCVPGFALEGRPDATCLFTGKWDGNKPRCVQVQCPALSAPLNGKINTSDPRCAAIVGGTCSVTCNDPKKYELKPFQPYVCNENGVWTGRPKCVLIPVNTCNRALAEFENGVVKGDCGLGVVGSKCTFTCNDGYKRIGPSVLTCYPTATDLTKGEWRPPGKQATCRKVRCPAVQAPSNGLVPTGQCVPGTVDASCIFKCDTGFIIKGSDKLTCTVYEDPGDLNLDGSRRGVWSADPPICVKSECPYLFAPVDGSLEGSCEPGRGGDICAFFCAPGYRVKGKARLVCLDDGNWDGVVPICEPYSGGRDPRTDGPGDPGSNPTRVPGELCPTVTVPRGGTMSGTCTPGRPGRRCTIRCPRGYRGSRTARCLPNGRWTPRFPSCLKEGGRCPPRRRCCPPVTAPRFGRVMNCNLHVGGKCNVACNPGFRSNVRGSMTCMGNRSWMPNMTLFNCNHRQSRVRRIRLG